MEQHNFPGLPAHRRQHEEFRRRMALFMEAHGAGKPWVPVSVML
jgi:hemerythrin